MFSRALPLVSAIATALQFLPVRSDAAALAYDDASDLAYAAGWASGSNGGFGFNPWTINPNADTGESGTFIGDSTLNGDANGGINTEGKAWGMYANNGQIMEALRAFTPGGPNGSSALGIGQQVVLKWDTGYIDEAESVGFGLRSGTNPRFAFRFVGGTQKYELTVGSLFITQHDFTDDGLTATFTLTGANSYRFDLSFASGSPATETFNGTLGGPSGSGIDNIRFFNANAGGGSEYDLYLNSLQIVPEPSSFVLAAVGFLALGRRFRRNG